MNGNIETPRLNNPESIVLTDNGFNNSIVLIFTDLKKAQIYKIPYRNSPPQEIEILISFDYLHLFRPNEVQVITVENRILKNFYSKLKKKNIFMWEKNFLVLKQTMKL